MSSSLRGSKAVLTEVIVYALGGAAQRAAFLLLVPILGHILQADDYGRWTIFIALVPMLASIMDFGFSKAIGRFYFDYDHDRAQLAAFVRRAVWLRALTYAILITPVTLALYYSWTGLTGGKLAPDLFILPLLIACMSETILLAVTAFSRARHIAIVFGALRLGQGLLTVAFPFLLAKQFGLQGAALGLSAANLIASVGAIVWIFSWVARQPPLDLELPRFAGAGPMIRYSAPVVVHDLSWWIRNSSTLVVLSHFVTAALVGAYSVGFAALSLVAMLSWSLDFATAPYYYRWRKHVPDWKLNVKYMLNLINGLIFAACAPAILLFSDMRAIFFGTKFAEADAVAPLLLIAGMLQPIYFMAVKPYFYLKRTAMLSQITFITSASLILLSIVAIWQFGFIAAAWVTILSYASVAIIGYWLSLRLEQPPFSLNAALRPTLACGAIAALTLSIDVPLWGNLGLSALLVAATFRWSILPSLKLLQKRDAFKTS